MCHKFDSDGNKKEQLSPAPHIPHSISSLKSAGMEMSPAVYPLLGGCLSSTTLVRDHISYKRCSKSLSGRTQSPIDDVTRDQKCSLKP